MIGRSLLSLVSLALVAMQAAVVSAISDGNYTIRLSDTQFLSSLGTFVGAPAVLLPRRNQPGLQEWFIQNLDDEGHVWIRNARSQHFLAPNPKEYEHSLVTLSSHEFVWRLHSFDYPKHYIVRPGPAGTQWLVLGPSTRPLVPTRLETQLIGSTDQEEWLFSPVKEEEEEPRQQCGPWRMQKEWVL